MRVCGAVDVLHGARVKPGVVDAGTHRRRGGVEVAHLLGVVSQIAAELGQLDGIFHRGPRVRAHEVGHHVLLLATRTRGLLELVDKALVDVVRGLAHHTQHVVAHVLGRQAQLARGVVFGQLADEGVVLVVQRVVKADAAADEDLLDAGNRAELAQQPHVALVGYAQVGAGLGRKAATVHAGAGLCLLGAGGLHEVCRGAANVVDVALEVGVVRHGRGLGNQGLVASRLDDAPLVEVERAERALAQAAAVAGKRELHLGDGRDAAGGVVHGVRGAGVGKLVDRVELRRGKRKGGRVLYHVDAVLVLLDKRMREVRVKVSALDAKAARVLGLVGAHCLPGGENHGIHALLGGSRAVDRSGDPAYVVDVHAAVERVGNLDDGALAHAVGDDVGAGVQKDRTLERIRPVVVVGEAAQRCLDAAQHDGHVLVRAADEVAVDHVRVVGAQAHLAAGGVEVLGAAVLCHGVVVDHRVHVATAYEKRQARLAQDGDACGVAPVGLRDDAHLVAVRLQHARDDGAGKRGVVNVGVTAHKDEVALVPAARLHVLA